MQRWLLLVSHGVLILLTFFNLSDALRVSERGSRKSQTWRLLQTVEQKDTSRTSCYPSSKARRERLSPAEIHNSVQDDNKFFWIIPRPAGLNNQLISIYEQLVAAVVSKRTVVVPHIHDHVTWSGKSNGLFPFVDYFDLNWLRSYGIKAVTPPDAARACTEGVAGVEPATQGWATTYERDYGVHFREFEKGIDSETCVSSVNGSASFETIRQSFPEYSNYQMYGCAYSLRADVGKSKLFSYAWFAVQPSSTVLAKATELLKTMPLRFNSMHLRRGDYMTHCRTGLAQAARPFGMNSCVQGGPYIMAKMQQLDDPSLPVFVATDDRKWAKGFFKEKLIPMFVSANMSHSHMSSSKFFFVDELGQSAEHLQTDSLPSTDWPGEQTDLMAMVEQILTANAEQFVANRFSSFSATINNMRLECNSQAKLTWW